MVSTRSSGSVFAFAIFLAFTRLSSAKQTPGTSNEFLRISCRETTYPSLCYSSLSGHAILIQTSPKLLASTALGVTLDSVRSTSTMMVTPAQGRGMSPREAGAMRDCVEQLAEAVDGIKDSIDEMSHITSSGFALTMNDVETWVSAALTEETTCSDGFAGPSSNEDVKTVVRDRIVTIAHLTSNALALMNRYSSSI